MYRHCMEKVDVDQSRESLRKGGFFFYFSLSSKGEGGWDVTRTFTVY